MRFFSLSAICKWRLSKSALYISRIGKKQNNKNQRHHKQKRYNIFIKWRNQKEEKENNRRPANFKSRRRKKSMCKGWNKDKSLEKFAVKAFTTKPWKYTRLIKNRNLKPAQRTSKVHNKINILIILASREYFRYSYKMRIIIKLQYKQSIVTANFKKNSLIFKREKAPFRTFYPHFLQKNQKNHVKIAREEKQVKEKKTIFHRCFIKSMHFSNFYSGTLQKTHLSIGKIARNLPQKTSKSTAFFQ